MRVTLIALSIGTLAFGAIGAELPLTGSYGSPSGCALELGGASDASLTDTVAFNARQIRFEGGVCPITSVKDTITATGEPGWEIGISCASGHDEEIRGTLNVAETADKTSLSATLIKGAGPEGEFPACAAPPVPGQ